MKVHRLKSWPGYFSDVITGKKSCEIRLNDRSFAIGDVLILAEYDGVKKEFTGRETVRVVTHVLTHENMRMCSQNALGQNWCALSIREPQ